MTAPSFRELGVSPHVVEALSRRGVEAPFPIQAMVVPDALAGRDVLGRSQTGSGKTLVFALPIVERMDASAPRPSALVVQLKVMLDAVFNHAGYYFPPFQDVLINGEQSEYKDWFHIREFPIRTKPIPSYDTFAFEPLMPKFNTEHPEVKEYLLNVARYWIEEVGIDGWRLDVANEVDHQFWREFREVVKQAKPDAYILGETWHHSYAWLQGDQFDAVMNYPVTNAVLDFFCTAETDARQFASAINRVHARYPWSVQEVSFNLLGSHDTPRLLTKCGDDKRRMKTAVAFLLTYLGTPCIYYGDEVGLNGNTDPDCRKTMIWDEAEQDRDLYRFYQRMIALRKRYRALRDGRFSIAYARQDNRVVGFERKYGSEPPIIVLINAGSTSETVSFDAAHEVWQDVYGEKAYTARGGQLKVEMAAYDVAILRAVVQS
jgi:cyclomaltodextrinase / maltogenic alpha-amylase / neopullulanase